MLNVKTDGDTEYQRCIEPSGEREVGKQTGLIPGLNSTVYDMRVTWHFGGFGVFGGWLLALAATRRSARVLAPSRTAPVP